MPRKDINVMILNLIRGKDDKNQNQSRRYTPVVMR